MTKTDIKDVSKPGLEKTTEKLGEYSCEIVRDFYGQIDPFYLPDKNPKYAYRFLRDEPKNLMMKTGNLLFQKGGWQICPRNHLITLGIKDEELDAKGQLRRGDQILAYMPRALYEEKEKYKRDKATAPMRAIDRLLKEGNPREGGKEIHPTMRGIQTAQQLRMKS